MDNLCAEDLSAYRPNGDDAEHLWDEERNYICDVVSAVPHASYGSLTTTVGLVLRYALYLESKGQWRRSSGEELAFSPGLVADYARHRAGLSYAGSDTSQSTLKQIGKARDPHLWVETESNLRVPKGRHPYSLAEQHAYREVAASDGERFAATISAGFGAGLAAQDFRFVRGRDVKRRASRLCVAVRSGDARERDVPVLDEWAEMLERAAAQMGDELLVSGTDASNKNFTSRVTRPLKKKHGLDLDIQRMRNTWIVSLLTEGISERMLRQYAGVQETMKLHEYDQWLPPLDGGMAA